MKEITDEEILEMLFKLDECAREYDKHDYGLPIFVDYDDKPLLEGYQVINMIQIVREFLKK